MVTTEAVDIKEFARFIITGITAAIANIAVLWLTLYFASFEIALLAGIAAGVTISFILSKWFAFSSQSWQRTGGEAVRFLIVYAVGCAVYWGVAVACGRFGLAHGVPPRTAEIGGALVGAGTMVLTSYFGHRFITYRTYRRAAERPGRAS
jgi:putative flippase GtrA